MAAITFAPIKLDNSTPKFSEAAIVFGFGEITFPHFPPPIIASKIAIFE